MTTKKDSNNRSRQFIHLLNMANKISSKTFSLNYLIH